MTRVRKITALVLLALIVSSCGSSPTSGSRVPVRTDNSNANNQVSSTPPEKTRDPIPRSGDPDTRVWVNTNSGVYHCPGTPWYGNTKSGEYMTQKEAQAKGYRPAHRSVCG